MPLLRDILIRIEQGRYAIPEIQRPYVWRNRQVLELLDSISQSLPVGSIIVWEMKRELVDNYGDLLRPLADELESKRKNFQFMVIDGQQRLVSLYLVKKGSIKINNSERSIALYFNPTLKGEDRFKLTYGKKLEKDPYWFNVSSILNVDVISDLLEEKAEISGDENIARNKVVRNKLEKFRNNVLNYPLNVYSIPEDALRYDEDSDNFPEILEKISEMFVKLNSTGTRIKMTHLVTAVLTAKTRQETGESFKKKIADIDNYFATYYKDNWNISDPVLMRTYMAIATDTTRFKEAKDKLKSINSTQIINYLNYTEEALKKAINVLVKELNVKGMKFLKSKYLLVPLAYYLFKKHTITPEDIHMVKRWVLLSSFNRRYTGRLESDLQEDIKLIRDELSLKNLEYKLAIKEIAEPMLDGTYDREHITALLILLKNSYDLKKDCEELIRIGDIADIHIHHIFPKDLLRKVYGEKIGDMNIEAAYDLLGNITIISKDANESIGAKRPDEYLKDFTEEVLKSHCIPLDPELWKPENYEKFVNQRRRQLFQKIKSILQI
ncbi:MAG: GmrSD restriction endonuclease domain-containing protein [Candidatus Odinarchaeia archaeon]